jgi:transcriptional regulator with XRE-family HTH domain
VRSRLESVLARRLREVAKEKRVPLSHVADRAGVARSYFWLLLDGSNSATLAIVQRIAEALDVEPLALLGKERDDARQRDAPEHRQRDRPPVERAAAEAREVRPPKRGRKQKLTHRTR